MTDQEIIKRIATEVMGWEFMPENTKDEMMDHWVLPDGQLWLTWNPLESWQDCGMLIEKDNTEIRALAKTRDGQWFCKIVCPVNFHVWYDKTPTRAITMAIANAYGIFKSD